MHFLKLTLVTGFLFAAGAVTLTLPTDASAHEAKLDSMGCHYARNHRNYHCHTGVLKDMTFKSRGEAIRKYNRIKAAKKKDDDGF